MAETKKITVKVKEPVKLRQAVIANGNQSLYLDIYKNGQSIAVIIHTNKFEAFENARKYACYVGIAPFESTSGTSIKGKPHVCSTGERMLKPGLSMAAGSARIHNPETREYFERKMA